MRHNGFANMKILSRQSLDRTQARVTRMKRRLAMPSTVVIGSSICGPGHNCELGLPCIEFRTQFPEVCENNRNYS